MDTVRRVDWIIQAIIAVISIGSLMFSVFFVLYGEIILGAWQVVSALLNTLPIYRSPYRKRIVLYWILTIASLLMLVSRVEWLLIFSVAGSWGIAVYYWIIYKSFIDHLSYRKELSTVLRNK